jgi:hypothetical protein
MPHYPRLAVAALACAASACNPMSRRGRAAADQPAVVVFENQSLYEAGVYAVPRGGTAVRIGTVPPGRTDTLTLRGASLPAGGSVALVARLLADPRTPTTGPLSIQAGEHIAVTLPSQANILTVLPGAP